MKIAGAGDLHIRKNKPKRRLDNYYETILRKFKFIYSECRRRGVDVLGLPGDVFDSYKTPHEVIGDVIKIMKRYHIITAVCWGQHDMRFHSLDVTNTPLSVLEKAGMVHRVVPDVPFLIESEVERVNIWGSSWGEPLPEKPTDKDAINILLTHRMIIDDKKVWEGQEEYTRAMHLIRDCGMDGIISGDNHTAFHIESKGKWLVNCGSMMRANVNQATHEPHFFIYDTQTGELEKVMIPVEPFEDVMDLTVMETTEVALDQKMEDFINSIGSDLSLEIDFKANVMHVIEGMDDPVLMSMATQLFKYTDSMSNYSEEEAMDYFKTLIKKEFRHGGHSETVEQIKRIYSGRKQRESSV
jgi:DNA repair exonuclease SbcCD nuclease subunit